MRVSEWVIAVFFVWTTILALSLQIPGHIRVRTLLANLIVLLAYVVLLRLQKHAWARTVRDWLPQALMILAYKQMGWFAPETHTYRFEHTWIVWDRILLNDLHGRSLIEFAGPVLPALLEFCYALVYAVPPITMLVIYGAGLRRQADTLLTIYLLGLFLCYAQFPLWPSEPPRTVFPGQDLPTVHTFLRTFNLSIVGDYGIHTSVFPSAHVSGAFAAACAIAYLLPRNRLLVSVYFAYAILVAIATVYGRYHYVVDAVAGIVIGILSFPIGIYLMRISQPPVARPGC
jgi:membrane-associated phospholipid phosphatase